ncbi:MAG: hypothetical protein JWM19_1948 [Actinomycetia bacterium]|nr:hypothetical protein [Actinomycetes bacterium]
MRRLPAFRALGEFLLGAHGACSPASRRALSEAARFCKIVAVVSVSMHSSVLVTRTVLPPGPDRQRP